MSSTINPYQQASQYITSFWSQASQSFWGSTTQKDENSDQIWEIFSEQCDAKVNLCLQGVSDRVVSDLAGETADYLADKPELAEEYVLVIVEPAGGDREVRAYRAEDLVADLEGEEKEKALETLKDTRLFYHTSTSDLPEMPDDEELQGLADTASGFLEKNSSVINILAREGYLSWE